jgi:multidrug efflux pump subunit AcrA (membrane-fusion protein)
VAVRASEEISFDPPAARPAQTTAGPAAAAEAERKLLYYRNPMGLPDTSPVPKKDWMGMDYLPVYAGEEADDKVIKLSPGRIQRSGVRSQAVVRQAISRPIRVPGTVQLDERRISVVATRSDSFIQEVAPITTGDRVAKGDRLVRIYSPEITAAGAQFVSELNAAGRGVPEGGARQRLENLGVQPEIVAEIERTRKVPLTIVWSAPRDGIVLERNVVDGMRMASGDSLFRLADVSMIWVLADVPEGDLAAIRIGAPAIIRLRGRPGTEFAGKVGLIYPQVAEATRTTKVRIEIDNRAGMLLPNMYADVEIGSGEAGPVLAVPDSAVIDTGTRRGPLRAARGEARPARRRLWSRSATASRRATASSSRQLPDRRRKQPQGRSERARRAGRRSSHDRPPHRLVGAQPRARLRRHGVRRRGGHLCAQDLPLDAIPDLSDVQVIVYTEYPGQAPQVVEDQVTYPLTTAMLTVPKSKWCAASPSSASPSSTSSSRTAPTLLGALAACSNISTPPHKAASRRRDADAGTRTRPASAGSTNMRCHRQGHDARRLRSLQDWVGALRASPRPRASPRSPASAASSSNIAIVVDPVRLRAQGMSLARIREAVRASNMDVGGRTVELSEFEFMVRGRGYLKASPISRTSC